MGIIDGEVISASAHAAANTVLLIISRARFKQLVDEHPELGAKLLWKMARIISMRLRQSTGLLAELSMAKTSRVFKY